MKRKNLLFLCLILALSDFALAQNVNDENIEIVDNIHHYKDQNEKEYNHDKDENLEVLNLFTEDIDNIPKPDFKPSHFLIKYTKMFGGELVGLYLDLKDIIIKKYRNVIVALKVLRYNIN